MHLSTLTTLLLTTLTIKALASPLPTFTDIERRWSEGETDATIHAHHNPRTATPSWPLSRPSSKDEESFDALTQLSKRSEDSAYNTALRAKLRAFAERLLGSKGGFIETKRGMVKRALSEREVEGLEWERAEERRRGLARERARGRRAF